MPLERPVDGVVWFAADLREAANQVASLHPAERAHANSLRLAVRRRTWLAGRVAAHRAVEAACPAMAAADRFEIRAHADGAPEAWVGDQRLPVSVSIAHRADRVVAAAAATPLIVGCDLERIEPRSAAFVRDFFTEAEAEIVFASKRPEVVANLFWCLKEATLKVRRTGLRRDTRSVEVTAAPGSLRVGRESAWQTVEVVDRVVPGGISARWRIEGAYVAALAVARQDA